MCAFWLQAGGFEILEACLVCHSMQHQVYQRWSMPFDSCLDQPFCPLISILALQSACSMQHLWEEELLKALNPHCCSSNVASSNGKQSMKLQDLDLATLELLGYLPDRAEGLQLVLLLTLA